MKACFFIHYKLHACTKPRSAAQQWFIFLTNHFTIDSRIVNQPVHSTSWPKLTTWYCTCKNLHFRPYYKLKIAKILKIQRESLPFHASVQEICNSDWECVFYDQNKTFYNWNAPRFWLLIHSYWPKTFTKDWKWQEKSRFVATMKLALDTRTALL